MNDLISRSALIAFIKANGMVYANTLETFPAVDAEPVVRCKDCQYRDTGNCAFDCFDYEATDDAYCSYGKRRNGDATD